ncbi:MAG: hypothetical protein FWG82_06975, partial [Oscillospiraceae bacterium]|nr:hypothetical protein [Oscillospiraceae bacterium]
IDDPRTIARLTVHKNTFIISKIPLALFSILWRFDHQRKMFTPFIYRENIFKLLPEPCAFPIPLLTFFGVNGTI